MLISLFFLSDQVTSILWLSGSSSALKFLSKSQVMVLTETKKDLKEKEEWE
jgi:hypothetical protein